MPKRRIEPDELARMLRENEELSVVGEKKPKGAKGTKKARTPKKESETSRLVAKLLLQLRFIGVPEPRQEHRFHPTRNWRFDLDWQEHGRKVAVEVDGGIWMQTGQGYSKGHAHPVRFEEDLEKVNEAQRLGWFVIRVGAKHINNGQAVQWISDALASGRNPA